ncbi:cob(I)yrinic acid a,c-diamide adenosyltransferase [Roseomonas xinghualingensis]|uniref:cob(I)yrinic acid a,c-diamide adenosyltransferase n=1 Tax=Roseomonas xinghualingensis TaxID=2986475 RepID=UPI0021F1F399|nr:cob(I)yrinic acid a,c-diamide adenosyltransferase [Roseomonas sp. SXEYE001]MCV4207868.1 cob(I)yrinic acid a,c-diamide adenosyltransferase [Roseomonas sp. SXEYE001]
MVKLDVITTRGGDSGQTSLGDGTRVSKDSARIEALGAVDEVNAAIGLLRLHTAQEEDAMLGRIQNDLFDLGADLCVPGAEGGLRISAAQCLRLERELEEMNAGLPPLRSFILPGGTPAAAHAHLVRTLARRAERAVVALAAAETVNGDAVRYLNRLSDHLFVLARCLNMGQDLLWKPGGNR